MYVEVDAMQPTGLYKWDEKEIEKTKKLLGFANEEYGIFKGLHLVNRDQYDDGGAEIDGEPVDIRDDSELRIRYITQYNFLIAPHGSPINNSRFDLVLKKFLDRMIQDDAQENIEMLQKLVEELPTREEFGRPM